MLTMPSAPAKKTARLASLPREARDTLFLLGVIAVIVLPQTIAHRLTPVGDAGRGAVEQVRAMMAAVPLP